jgi:hypothetical protein
VTGPGGLPPSRDRRGLAAGAELRRATATRRTRDGKPSGQTSTRGKGRQATDGIAPERFVAPAPHAVSGPLIRLRLRIADRVLVEAGERVDIGQPLMERSRDATTVEVRSQPALARLRAGDVVEASLFEHDGGSRGARPGDRARLLFHGPDGRVRLAIGRHPSIVTSPVNGVVEALGAGTLDIRSDGVGLPGAAGWGQPVHGPLFFGVSTPDAELRASSIDVGAAGTIVVAGARLDIEALTRARAIGVAGILCGGVVGRELRQLDESDRRQRAALHAATPFAVLALDGFGRRPMPGPTWDLLRAAAADGRIVGLVPETRWAVVSGDAGPLGAAATRNPAAVRIAAGDGLGREGVLVGLAGPVRRPGGLYQQSGYVDDPSASDGQPRRRVVALADLERFE